MNKETLISKTKEPIVDVDALLKCRNIITLTTVSIVAKENKIPEEYLFSKLLCRSDYIYNDKQKIFIKIY